MKTKIEWTNRVWNFLTGCTKVSAGCKFCYMFILAARLKAMGQDKYRNGAKLTIHETEITNPYSWKQPSMVFVNSMSDMFHEVVPLPILLAAFEVMNNTPQHTYQILTKRPERLLELQHHFNFTPNIWIGVSVEDSRVMHRIETLKMINAKLKWISAEPLIGPLTNLNLDGISWVIVGGESGNNRGLREINKEWINDILLECRKKGVPFFFKQWGKPRFNPNPNDPTISKEHPQHAKGGCQLNGIVYREFPNTNPLTPNQLKQTMMKTENKNAKAEIIAKLSPVKKLIGEALLKGESENELANRLSKERNKPLASMKAYVTMVTKLLNENPGEHSKIGTIEIDEVFPKSLKPKLIRNSKSVIIILPNEIVQLIQNKFNNAA